MDKVNKMTAGSFSLLRWNLLLFTSPIFDLFIKFSQVQSDKPKESYSKKSLIRKDKKFHVVNAADFGQTK